MSELPSPLAAPILAAPAAPAGGFAAISKYNPHLWSPEQLRAIFVTRQNELAELLRSLRTTPPASVGQHVLLVGSRGMGKSTLMQRLALAVEDDAELRAGWLPLRFPEEQYTVSTLGQFWANVLDALADARERQGQDTTALDAAAERIAALPPGEQEAACLAALDSYASEQRQRLLLLVDNTDLLLHNIGPEAHWTLRRTLQANPHLLWVGGSYQSLEADSNYHDAFLDFFHIFYLRPLRQEEMQQALLALASIFGGEPARQRLAQRLAAHPERLATLHRLSGGNPRTTVMLYELLAHDRDSTVRSDLEALLDDMTPLYKARMDALADQPRKLLAHILEHWAPISLATLAEVSQIAKTTISPQLLRLEREGFIVKTARHGTRRSGYQVAERFFNIWYLMRFSPRRQRTKLAWLVEFMRLWFSTDELCHLARQRLHSTTSRPREWAHDCEYHRALADALPREARERHALRWSLLKQTQENRRQLAGIIDLDGDDRDFQGAADYLTRLRQAEARLRQCPHPQGEAEQQAWVEAVLGSLELTLADKEQLADKAAQLTVAEYQSLLQTAAKESQEWQEEYGAKACQTVRQAVLARDFFPDVPESELAYQQIHALFTDQPEALRLASALLYFSQHEDEWVLKTQELAQQVLPAEAEIVGRRAWLHERLGRYEEAETLYREAIALDETSALLWDSLGDLLQDHLGRYEEAEVAYRQAITLDEKDAGPWSDLGDLLQDHLSRYEEAEAAYRRAITLDGKDAELWNDLGDLLQDHLGRYEEAEAAYRQAITLDGKYAMPWNALGTLLKNHLGRYEEAEAAYRQAIALDEKSAMPWNGLGSLLKNYLGRYEEAEAAYRQAIALDKKYALPWNNLGNLLQDHLGRYEEAEAAYREAIALDEKFTWPWNNLGNLLQYHLGRYEEAEAAYRQAIMLNNKYALAWNNLGDLKQDHLGQYEEAEVAYRQAIQLDPHSPYPLCNLARLQVRQGRWAEANEQFQRASAVIGPEDAPLQLQAQLFLGNRQLAETALHTLISAAQAGNQLAFYRLKEQVWECHALGLGEALADCMAGSAGAVFLQPLIQALYILCAAEDKRVDLPQESQQLVDEIVQRAQSALSVPPRAPA